MRKITNPLDVAIEFFGSTTALADQFKISRQAVDQWGHIPLARALHTEKITNGRVSARSVLEYASKLKAG
jgi:DNA-binding transcriptional regulator YdaS (Cro superfamily)